MVKRCVSAPLHYESPPTFLYKSVHHITIKMTMTIILIVVLVLVLVLRRLSLPISAGEPGPLHHRLRSVKAVQTNRTTYGSTATGFQTHVATCLSPTHDLAKESRQGTNNRERERELGRWKLQERKGNCSSLNADSFLDVFFWIFCCLGLLPDRVRAGPERTPPAVALDRTAALHRRRPSAQSAERS